MTSRRVGVIRGGNKTSHAVSMRTGAVVVEELLSSVYEVKDIVISPQGEWLVRGFVQPPLVALSDVDVVFVSLQDSFGQYQTVQRLLDTLSIPYTGSRTLVNSYALNKVVTKEQAEALGLKVPRHMVLHRDNATDVHRLAFTIGELFTGDIVIKPQFGGYSTDTYLVSPFSPLAPILQEVLAQHETLLVEERIIGKEATVGILEGYRNEPCYVFPPVEVRLPSDATFYSREIKESNQAQLLCPGNFSAAEQQALLSAAKNIHSQLGLQHYSRSDFIVTNDSVYFLEVNAVPDLIPTSPFMTAVESVGGTTKELVTHLISLTT